MNKDLLSFAGMQPPDFEEIWQRTARLKKMLKEGKRHASLAGKTLGMIFDKSSTRTRISFEVGMYQLGGIALFLNSRDTQIGRGETLADSARMMSCYLNGIMIRTFAQESVEELARYATIPVINGLTDLLHPCQILADLFTIQEKKGSYEGIRVAYIGDGNNVANSWIEAAAHLPFELALACPEGYDPDERLMKESRKHGRVRLGRDPFEAAADADVLYTDVWTSMGQEAESKERKKVFANYQINQKLLKAARKDAIVMHCLPAHRGEEITAEVIDGPQSVVVEEAENRLHVQKAVLEILL
ncbi:MAG TPA: ornithine carbamoyltransferase [Smithellaceae bacterium]|nr:ornithine carbamoyltransferase [Smithellaceae bacterium]HRS83163.1 ornithine carbamoyltransferase [Smithellaceae bacterium]HRV44364.1 ornithine carbamoyltransferase [Smithellaceae bacterium]